MTHCGCRVLFRTRPNLLNTVHRRLQPVRVLSPKTSLSVVPVSFEESFTSSYGDCVTRYFNADPSERSTINFNVGNFVRPHPIDAPLFLCAFSLGTHRVSTPS